MEKFHSTVSRRDFMKALGFAGVGVGAATASSPIFHDLDEVISAGDLKSDPWANYKRPWWVKERDFKDPSIEVDWNKLETWNWGSADNNTTLANPRHGAYGLYGQNDAKMQADMDAMAEVSQYNRDYRENELKKGTPGFARRDWALYAGSRYLTFGSGMEAWPWGGKHPETALGVPFRTVPKWTGTPEEATNMLRAAAHAFEAPNMGVIEHDSDTKKLFYTQKYSRWEDVDTGYEDEKGIGVIPNSCKWGVYLVIRQNEEATRKGYSGQHGLGRSVGYFAGPLILRRMQQFVGGLGYQTYGPKHHYHGAGMNVAMGPLCGLSELGRTGTHITPEFGTMIRYTPGLLTDLPQAPTKPIDAGMSDFCKTCKLCAKFCNEVLSEMTTSSYTQVIPMDDEPTYEVTGPWNRVGIKQFPHYWPTCNCGTHGCITACPFATKGSGAAAMHGVIRAMIGTSTLFNGFFASMEDTFYPHPHKTVDEMAAWWDRELTTWKYDRQWIHEL